MPTSPESPASCRALAAVRLTDDLGGCERAADDRLSERVRHLAVGLQVGPDMLLHGEPTSAWPMRLLSAFQSPADTHRSF